MTDLERGLEQIKFARNYTLWLVDSIPVSEWFTIPPAGVSHIGWQVGHLAMAEYRLILDRFRGRRPEDEALISDAFLSVFGRESVPVTDPALSPPAEELRAVLDRVHAQVLRELPTYSDADLDVPGTKPHRTCKTRRDFLFWCSAHEMVHAGQIGLLRRQLGHAPLW
jgi:hypothetical protein